MDILEFLCFFFLRIVFWEISIYLGVKKKKMEIEYVW